MASQDTQQLQCQLQSASSQLQVLGDQLRAAEAEVAKGKAQMAESKQHSEKHVMQLESKLMEAMKRSEHYRKLCQLTPESITSAEQDLMQQLQSANSTALHSAQVVHAREKDIQALQQALEEAQRDKDDMQHTLSAVVERHAGLHSEIVEVGPYSFLSSGAGGLHDPVARLVHRKSHE